MKTIKITILLLMICSYAYAQNEVRMVKTTDEIDGSIYLQEESNFRVNTPILHLDGTPYPAWQDFGFENIGGFEPIYRSIGEVLDIAKIANLVRSGRQLYVISIFNLDGDVLEVAFCFSNEEVCSQIRQLITDQEFYRIAQKLKQYEKYSITSDNTDIQWLAAFGPVDFRKVRDWKWEHLEE